MSPKMLAVHTPEVAEALENGKPVVALESTIITHGMPWPGNRDMALNVEATIREAGAVPATIAVLNGSLRIGLTEAEVTELAQTQDAMKVSRADLAFAIAQGRTGATTVAARAISAEKSTGSLMPGFAADITIIDAPSVNHWLYHFRANACCGVLKSGQWERRRF